MISVTRYLYRLNLAIDANFRMKCKDKKSLKDVPYGPGLAYMQDDKIYKEELAKHHDDIQQVSNSNFLRAPGH
jgi:hypothetical protein